jgi:amidophosphoribosyltransferase
MGSDSRGGWYFASESCAFTPIFVEYNRELEPGEMIVFEGDKRYVESLPGEKERVCLFELIYTARPDSILLGKSVYEIRKEFGRKLARRRTVGDVVVPVPSTSIPAAIGYSQATGIPIEQALVKNQYIHRTFIEPNSRGDKVGMKLSPIGSLLAEKEVALIDDSIVRGTTAAKIVQLVRDAGASKVHFLVSSPPVRFPDQTGIDISDARDLMAANNSIEQIRRKIGADSLTYLSLADTIEATGKKRNNFYLGPFTGEY